MQFKAVYILAAAVSWCTFRAAIAQQQPPAVGYMFPPGCQAGQTIDVILGGYDWTPDMELFVHDPRIKLEIVAPPGPVTVPEPPYWIEKKARRGPFPLPREFRARLTVPADVPPGIVRWQAANANGASDVGRFVVGMGKEMLDTAADNAPQAIAELPVVVSGQIKKIAEVDRFQFSLPASGPVTCEVASFSIGSPLNAAVEIRDENGKMIASAADTAGLDLSLTFAAEANRRYVASVYDVDFRGDRSFVYRLAITPGPKVLAAIPAVGRRGDLQTVELIGLGVATDKPLLESVTRQIQFPADATKATFDYKLETPQGAAPPFTFQLTDLAQTVRATGDAGREFEITVPAAITGVMEQRFCEDRYFVQGKKDELWSINALAQRIGSRLDVTLAVFGADGKELARNDDEPGTTDAAIQFTVPADGRYRISVTDSSGQSGNRAATYYLTLEKCQPGFSLIVPQLIQAPIGTPTKLALTVTRALGFNDPIAISLENLPPGVTAPAGLTIPAGGVALSIDLTVAADAAASARLVTIVGQAMVNEQMIRRTSNPTLVATTIKPPFSIDAEGLDDVVKWPRGSTFPSPALIERDTGFNAPIMLEMNSRQGRHVQGITGPELLVEPGVERILYPIFLPEWLETTRTSRMVVNGVAQVADPQGRVRYVLCKQKNRMGFLPTGALLKLTAEVAEIEAQPGQRISIPLAIGRTVELSETVHVELLVGAAAGQSFAAAPQSLTPDQHRATFDISIGADDSSCGEHELVFRATLLKEGKYPVVSETKVLVIVAPASASQ